MLETTLSSQVLRSTFCPILTKTVTLTGKWTIWSWWSFNDYIATFSGRWSHTTQEDIQYIHIWHNSVNARWVSKGLGLGKTIRFNRHLLVKPERYSGTGERPPCVWTETAGWRWNGGKRAGTEGAASPTQNYSLFGLHHIHLSDPLPLWLGRREKR